MTDDVVRRLNELEKQLAALDARVAALVDNVNLLRNPQSKVGTLHVRKRFVTATQEGADAA